MIKIDITKLNEIPAEDIEQYVTQFKAAMEKPSEVATEDIVHCKKVLTAVINGPNSRRFYRVNFKCKMLRHTVNNELASRKFSLRRLTCRMR